MGETSVKQSKTLRDELENLIQHPCWCKADPYGFMGPLVELSAVLDLLIKHVDLDRIVEEPK